MGAARAVSCERRERERMACWCDERNKILRRDATSAFREQRQVVRPIALQQKPSVQRKGDMVMATSVVS